MSINWFLMNLRVSADLPTPPAGLGELAGSGTKDVELTAEDDGTKLEHQTERCGDWAIEARMCMLVGSSQTRAWLYIRQQPRTPPDGSFFPPARSGNA
jgi:hypothetical protein